MAVVLGYADRQSVRPGEALRVMVSCEGTDRYHAGTVRLTGPDVGTGPDVPAFAPVPCPLGIDGEHAGGFQETVLGSYAVAAPDAAFARLTSFTVAAFVQPTLLAEAGQCLFGTLSLPAGRGFALWLDAEGAPCLVVGNGAGKVRVIVRGRPLRLRRWAFVAAAVDAARGVGTIFQRSVEQHRLERDSEAWTEATLGPRVPHHKGPLLMGATPVKWLRRRWQVAHVFNGRLERPVLLGRALSAAALGEMAAAGPAAPPHSDALADWDFSQEIGTELLLDVSGHARHAAAVNLPARGVSGSNWRGDSNDFRAAPSQYGAVHFHDDDLDDADWEPSLELQIPDDLASGCYAVRLTAEEAEFWVPFFVLPQRGAPRSDTAFLVPTCTYAAYANLTVRVSGQWNELVHGRLTVLDTTDLLMLDHPWLGKSTYDVHSDGSIVLYSSMRRPVTNFRPTGRIYKFCQDLLIVSWLERLGDGYDVLTDHVLHAEGAEALDGYRVVITASHPEYYSTPMLDNLETFLRRGGRMMYLGGNGFFWRTAWHPRLPGIVEVRRIGLDRLWATDESEGHFSSTGEPGGTWLKQGRPPNLICGVGFITQGFDACEGYRRHAASRDPRAAFVFAGVDDAVIGDFGLLMGGAAGYEIDRFDRALGSPPHALVLASSGGHSNLYDLMLTSLVELLPASDPDAPEPVRADMVFFETPGGGAVFSVGSIAWCGSLAQAEYRNNVAAVTENVLRRFRDPTPFEAPAT